MARILAIEPDRRQSAKLTMLARNQIHADLVIADSVEQALETLDDIIPDLVLTSSMLPSKDGAALAEKLRAMDAEGQHVKTFTIPALGVPGQKARVLQAQKPQPKGSRHRKQVTPPPVPGTDPIVFGMQVMTLLDRARTAPASGSNVTRLARPAAATRIEAEPIEDPSDAEAAECVETIELDADDSVIAIDLDADEQLPVFELADDFEHVAEPPAREVSIKRAAMETDWADLLSAMRRDIEQARHLLDPVLVVEHGTEEAAATSASAPPPSPNAPAAPAASVTTTAPAERATPETTVAASADGETATAAAKPKKRRPKAPRQDEWGFYDPQQCGLSVLIAKVNEITGNTGTTPKKPA